jgi:hypothetical protein
MQSPGSTLIDHTGGGRAGRHRTAAWILGAGQFPLETIAALLLPMVRRAVRTERGPAALVSWLRHRPEPPADRRTERAATLADELARLLADSAGSPDDTRDDL